MSGTCNLDGLIAQASTCIESAYNKGYKAAKEDIIAAGNKSEYERGLDDAEKAIKRVLNEPSKGGLYANEIQEIFGTKGIVVVLLTYSIPEIIKKIREYDNKKQVNNRCDTCKYQHLDREHFPCCDCCDNDRWEQGDSEIHVGDEVYCLDKNHKSIVVGFTNKNLSRCLVMSERGFLAMDTDTLHKTGRTYPVKEMFEKLNESEE